jgi:hypothetical protein
MLYLTPCNGVSPPVCGPCAQSCWPRFEIFSAEIYNPSYVSLTNADVGHPRGTLDTGDLYGGRLYYDNGTPVLVPEPDDTFPGPSTLATFVDGSVYLPSFGAYYLDSSAPGGSFGYSYIVQIPVTGTPNTLAALTLLREAEEDGVWIRFYGETLDIVDGRQRVKITVVGGMDTWPDGSTYFSKLTTLSSIYYDGEVRNALRYALGEAADPCGAMDIYSGEIYAGFSVLVNPEASPPWEVYLYAAAFHF